MRVNVGAGQLTFYRLLRILPLMAVIGITGSIASGKSTFRDILTPLLSACVLDADAIAKSLLEEDAEVRDEVREAISPKAYAGDGTADRGEIRRIIYTDPVAKLRLEAILHPRVRKYWVNRAGLAQQEGRHVLVDIPLLFETGADAYFDGIITVACSLEIQHARLARRGLDPALARKIIHSQMPVADKMARSTHVVWNDGEFDALKAQAEKFSAWLALQRFPASRS